MKHLLLLITFIFSLSSISQERKISSIDFVQVQNDNFEETMYYYENNWKVLRINALKKGYIKSYQILETKYTKEAPFHIMLITTYKNQEQFNKREEHFQELIKELGGLNLLNQLKPSDFRKTLFGTDAKHLN